MVRGVEQAISILVEEKSVVEDANILMKTAKALSNSLLSGTAGLKNRVSPGFTGSDMLRTGGEAMKEEESLNF